MVATTEPPLTVAEALRELREMFPDAKFITLSGDYTSHWNGESTSSTRIQIAGSWRDGQGKAFFTYPTLNEAMAQVRAWKETQG